MAIIRTLVRICAWKAGGPEDKRDLGGTARIILVIIRIMMLEVEDSASRRCIIESKILATSIPT